MNNKNPNGPIGLKSTKSGSRFARLIKPQNYAAYLADNNTKPVYDSQGRRVK